jgi:phosphoribosylglycinamide formyltransferase-1
MKNIILFASGNGSNAERIMHYFKGREGYNVSAVFTNNAKAGVIQKSEAYNVPVIVFNRQDMANGTLLKKVKNTTPDIIVLAGFLWKFPADIIKEYPDRVINIHPALLPKYGGKGMYGMNVHAAVYNNKEKESGISIHYVNDNYDEGNIIFQQTVAVDECISPEEVALKVLQLEHEYFPVIIERLLSNKSD